MPHFAFDPDLDGTSPYSTSLQGTDRTPSIDPATTSPAHLRMRGSGCATPALGCDRKAFTVAGGNGYLQRGYDSGRWWLNR